MLVKLYALPDSSELLTRLEAQGFLIRHPLPPEKHVIMAWVEKNFGKGWASECERTFSSLPVSSFIAIKDFEIIGFACYNATCKDFFGPTGVIEKMRGNGIGAALLLKSLEAMREQGYAYAIIGGAGPTEFYTKIANAAIIEGSVPGIYKDMLKL